MKPHTIPMILNPPSDVAPQCVVYISGHAVGYYLGVPRLYFRVPVGGEHEVPDVIVATPSMAVDVDDEDQKKARHEAKALMEDFGEASMLGLSELYLYRQLRALFELDEACFE